MGRDEKVACFQKLYDNETLHKALYKKMAANERNGGLKKILNQLADMEAYHEELWGKALRLNGVDPNPRNMEFEIGLLMALRRVWGTALTVKLMEYFEEGIEDRLNRLISETKLKGEEARIVNRIQYDTHMKERELEDAVVGYGRIFSNIRDVVFGMNDGLVELLAVVVGLAAAVNTPEIVLLGGIITAAAGTLSMAGGAYLSTEYEEKIESRDSNGAPLKSAFYVGVMYFIGTLFPLAPFAVGLSGMVGIAVAIIISAVVLTVVSVLIAVASGTSITGRVSKTLLISLGIDAITIIIGLYAKSVLHLPQYL